MSQPRFVLFNSAQKFSYIPQQHYYLMLANVKSDCFQKNRKMYCQCGGNFPTLSFTMGGKTFPFNPENYMVQVRPEVCLLTFRAAKAGSQRWILGSPFLKQYFSIYDLTEGHRRIGLLSEFSEVLQEVSLMTLNEMSVPEEEI